MRKICNPNFHASCAILRRHALASQRKTREQHMSAQRNKPTEQVTTDKLFEDLKAVVEDAEELLKATAGQAGDRITEARSRAEATVKAARKRMDDLQEDVLAQTKEVADQADAYVRKNPWQAVGIAAAAGVMIGLLLSRR